MGRIKILFVNNMKNKRTIRETTRVGRVIEMLCREISMANDVDEILILEKCLSILNSFQQNKLKKYIESFLNKTSQNKNEKK